MQYRPIIGSSDKQLINSPGYFLGSGSQPATPSGSQNLAGAHTTWLVEQCQVVVLVVLVVVVLVLVISSSSSGNN